MVHVGNTEAPNRCSWRNKRKCNELTPSQADDIFFVKSGGKSNRAKAYCADCPVLNKCLDEALNLGLVGMWAGTTDGERRRMAEFIGSLDMVMPTEPTAKSRRLRRIKQDSNPLDDPLFGVEGPSEEDLDNLTRGELSLYGLDVA